MNIAFEISPFLTASGPFGDKSGVYRYMYGLLSGLIEHNKKHNPDGVIVLFSFSPNLLTVSLNPEIAQLIDNKNVFILGYTDNLAMSEHKEHFYEEFIEFPLINFPLKIINRLFQISRIYKKITGLYLFRRYINGLKREFHKLNIDAVLHSETGFYYMEDFKNIITIYDVTTVLLPYLHREET